MIAEPFLLNEDCSLFVDNDTSTYGADLISAAGPHHGSLDVNDTINLPAKTLVEAQEMTKVRFAFWIMAAVMVCNAHIPLRSTHIAWTEQDKTAGSSTPWPGKTSATLFSTIIPAFLGRFLQFFTNGNKNEYSKIYCDILTYLLMTS